MGQRLEYWCQSSSGPKSQWCPQSPHTVRPTAPEMTRAKLSFPSSSGTESQLGLLCPQDWSFFLPRFPLPSQCSPSWQPWARHCVSQKEWLGLNLCPPFGFYKNLNESKDSSLLYSSFIRAALGWDEAPPLSLTILETAPNPGLSKELNVICFLSVIWQVCADELLVPRRTRAKKWNIKTGKQDLEVALYPLINPQHILTASQPSHWRQVRHRIQQSPVPLSQTRSRLLHRRQEGRRPRRRAQEGFRLRRN